MGRYRPCLPGATSKVRFDQLSSFTDRKIFALHPFRKMLTIRTVRVAAFLLGRTGGLALSGVYSRTFET